MASGRLAPIGDQRVVGALSQPVLDFLAENATTAESGAVTITDKVLLHMMREAKTSRGAALPVEDIRRLPELIGDAARTYWDAQDPALLYIYDAGSSVGKLVVRVGFFDKVRRQTVVTNAARNSRGGSPPSKAPMRRKSFRRAAWRVPF
ncbi:MAG: hypothetical protein HQL37_04215 [Alphaproteobacteria bacterium]|nr:hypothetical protein [Alphaproteobacteria bacterium]